MLPLSLDQDMLFLKKKILEREGRLGDDVRIPCRCLPYFLHHGITMYPIFFSRLPR